MATHSISGFHLVTRPASFGIGQAWALVRKWVRVRQTRLMLEEMDGRMLADIGSSRSEAVMESMRPFWDTAPPRR